MSNARHVVQTAGQGSVQRHSALAVRTPQPSITQPTYRLSGSPQKAKVQTRPSSAQFDVNPLFIFTILTACHTLAAFKAPIQDCDEVFNYWEPTHYLTDGTGFQTWEYAPQYAIRSWTYAGLHALPIALIRAVWPTIPKPALFYLLRISLGLVCAVCETKLFSAISRTLNERVAILFLIVLITSPGLYHASVAYLPSSLAMYTASLGASYFMDWSNKDGSVAGILCFGIGAIVGWPFAAVLILPFLLEELILAVRGDRARWAALLKRWTRGAALCLLVLALQTGIDSTMYRKVVIVPLNIVLYNVFSSKGPDLYGTEPWHFYLQNLALNFHVWLLLALLALPLFALLPHLLPAAGRKSYRGLYFVAPFYLWLAIFTLQPHKEERFMYPAYPFLWLNAAYSLHILLAVVGNTDKTSLASRIPVSLRLGFILLFLAGTALISALRIAAVWTAFDAPLKVYEPLQTVQQPAIVCLGKEWYRFPSHYLFPSNVEARFIRSEFRGLLPGLFTPANSSSPFSATWSEPTGMNDDNQEDFGKYVSVSACDYIVDSHLPSTEFSIHEPAFIGNDVSWQRVKCEPFLDAASTGTLGRIIWTPDLDIVPRPLRRAYGEYCLLKHVSKS